MIVAQFIIFNNYCDFSDPELIKATPLSGLKQLKAHMKIIHKRDKEIDTLRRKSERVCVIMVCYAVIIVEYSWFITVFWPITSNSREKRIYNYKNQLLCQMHRA